MLTSHLWMSLWLYTELGKELSWWWSWLGCLSDRIRWICARHYRPIDSGPLVLNCWIESSTAEPQPLDDLTFPKYSMQSRLKIQYNHNNEELEAAERWWWLFGLADGMFVFRHWQEWAGIGMGLVAGIRLRRDCRHQQCFSLPNLWDANSPTFLPQCVRPLKLLFKDAPAPYF